MFKHAILYCLIVFLVPLDIYCKGTKNKRPDGWTCVNTSMDYRHSERWIKSGEKAPVREIKLEMWVKCEMDSAFEVLNDPSNVSLWMKGVDKVEILKPENSEHAFAYTVFSFPWPFKNRDMVTRYESNLLQDDCYRITITSISDKVPECESTSRIRHYEAKWEIIPLKDDQIKVVFQVISNEAPVLPRFIQDPIVKQIFKENFHRLHQLLSKSRIHNELTSL